MFLNLYFDRRSQPALVLAADPVVELGFAIASLTVPPGPPELPAGGQVTHNVIAGCDLGGKYLLAIGSYRRKANMLAAGIDPKGNVLPVPRTAI